LKVTGCFRKERPLESSRVVRFVQEVALANRAAIFLYETERLSLKIVNRNIEEFPAFDIKRNFINVFV
jgi:hypothetical protein